MAKLQCPCGFTHDLTENSPMSWITVQEQQYAAMITEEISANDGDADARGAVIAKHGAIYACPECERIMWQRAGDSVIRVYTIEDAI